MRDKNLHTLFWKFIYSSEIFILIKICIYVDHNEWNSFFVNKKSLYECEIKSFNIFFKF